VIVHFAKPAVNWQRLWGGRAGRLLSFVRPRVPLVRPSLDQLTAPGYRLPAFVRACPVAMGYLRLLGDLPWGEFPERAEDRTWRGPRPAPRAPFAAAFLVKIDRRLTYMSDLRRFLIEHPALVWVLGFPLVADPAAAHGFDAARSVPSRKQFGRVLRELPQGSLGYLLSAVVHKIEAAVSEDPLGDTVAVDTKHILAWVKENNPKAYVQGRYDPDRQPTGDRDCRLGCKRKVNTPPEEAKPASSVSRGEYHWGYASGLVAAIVRGIDVVLAELTQTFDQADVTYFQPLMTQVERRLGRCPRFGALDAAFDAFYVYDYFAQAGGFAAVPFVARGGVKERIFDAVGLPICKAGLSMPLLRSFINRTSLVEHERGCYACPLIGVADACPVGYKDWPKGGCSITMATAPGARLRYQLDREAEEFKAVYRQRTACERINSQAQGLGIERPKLRNGEAIAHLNTLIYVLIDLRALGRIRGALAADNQAA
jgi:hypothetical protein